MIGRRGRHRPVLAALAAAALAGCGLGPGESSEGTATLTVTRDYGTVPVLEASVDDPDASETVLRMLDREADIETRFGGGFVQSIEGVAGEVGGGRRFDWFFYVNGVESPVGSADREVSGGDRIWWDHRDWTDAMRVPAVVGSWPEPFLQASAPAADRLPVRVECAAGRDTCREAAERLSDEGVSVSVVRLGSEDAEAVRVLVGPWRTVRRDPAAAQLDDGPAGSGVFARFAGPELLALDEEGRASTRLGAGAGLVAAVRDGEEPPAWLVTGVDRAGVRAAAAALGAPTLRDRYAVAVGAGSDRVLPIPVVNPG